MSCCVQVAVDNAAFKFDKLYSYAVPEPLQPFAKVGARVAVPFGGANAARVGVILRAEPEPSPEKLKELLDIERGEPLISQELVQLILFLKEQTLCTYSDALKTVIPKNSRVVLEGSGLESSLKEYSKSHLETVFKLAKLDVAPRLTKKQAEVVQALKSGARSYAEINAEIGVSRGVVNLLTERGILEKTERRRDIELYGGYEGESLDNALTPAQQAVFDEILAYVRDREKPNTTLLHGVTSSGKTLVYAALVKQVLEKSKSALLLVPEITLATQLIYRFKSMFGDRVGIIHSALSTTERQIQWQRINEGEYDVVIGTRSAVFSPLKNLGLLIVDEEQEATYYSEQSPRYSAVSVAAFRAKINKAHLLLASATPSVESYYWAAQRRYNLVTLEERYGNMPLPTVSIVDMREEVLLGNALPISARLKDEIDSRLEKKQQCILLLNRRGYETVSICTDCKTVVKCDSCEAAMVYHKDSGKLHCHYCGRQKPPVTECPLCGGAIRQTGIGTQKIEEQLETLFPAARIARLDLDAVSKKNAASEILRDFARGEYDIVVGTQMVAKGLDFKNVTLVGVLNIDQMLLMADYKANERTFAMLTQVVGRSGRGELLGEAVVQTIDPQNPIIRLAAEQDYISFYSDEIVSRQLHLYPPFCSICTIGVLSGEQQTAEQAALEMLELLKNGVTAAGDDMPVRILGPAPMRVGYVNGMHRQKLTIKCKNNRAFRDVLRAALLQFTKKYSADRVRVFVDFGPFGDAYI